MCEIDTGVDTSYLWSKFVFLSNKKTVCTETKTI